MKLRVLDLFSGTGGFSEAFRVRGHTVDRIDNDPQFQDVPNTVLRDVLGFPPGGQYDVVVASPPCQAFSLAATGTHMEARAMCRCGTFITKRSEKWKHITEHIPVGNCEPRSEKGTLHLLPKTEFGKLSVRLVKHTLTLIDQLKPRFWWMENPNGGMIHFVPESIPRVQITQCQYGENRQKLTNLWGNWPEIWVPRPRCKNGDPCHDAAPRGAKTGTQGIRGAVARAAIPFKLSLEICEAVEEAME